MSIKSSLKKIVEALGGSVTGKSIPGLLKDIIKANGGEPEGKNISDLLGDISENVSGGGGDFGTANVKIMLRSMSDVKGGFITFNLPTILDDKIELHKSVHNLGGNGEITETAFPVVLYNGVCDCASFVTDGLAIAGQPTFTGGCALSQDGKKVVITGDGTITIPVVAS